MYSRNSDESIVKGPTFLTITPKPRGLALSLLECHQNALASVSLAFGLGVWTLGLNAGLRT